MRTALGGLQMQMANMKPDEWHDWQPRLTSKYLKQHRFSLIDIPCCRHGNVEKEQTSVSFVFCLLTFFQSPCSSRPRGEEMVALVPILEVSRSKFYGLGPDSGGLFLNGDVYSTGGNGEQAGAGC